MPFEVNSAGWDELVKRTVDEVCVPLCQGIADASNKSMEERVPVKDKESRGVNTPGYIVGTKGGKHLDKHDYRATVITATNQAMVDNAEHNTLIMNMHEGA
jgi:hypothetical protein